MSTTHSHRGIVILTTAVSSHPLLTAEQITLLGRAIKSNVFTVVRKDGDTTGDLVMSETDVVDFAENVALDAADSVKEVAVIHTEEVDLTEVGERFPGLSILGAVADADDWTARRLMECVHRARAEARRAQR